jgi:hypothetical protein
MILTAPVQQKMSPSESSISGLGSGGASGPSDAETDASKNTVTKKDLEETKSQFEKHMERMMALQFSMKQEQVEHAKQQREESQKFNEELRQTVLEGHEKLKGEMKKDRDEMRQESQEMKEQMKNDREELKKENREMRDQMKNDREEIREELKQFKENIREEVKAEVTNSIANAEKNGSTNNGPTPTIEVNVEIPPNLNANTNYSTSVGAGDFSGKTSVVITEPADGAVNSATSPAGTLIDGKKTSSSEKKNDKNKSADNSKSKKTPKNNSSDNSKRKKSSKKNTSGNSQVVERVVEASVKKSRVQISESKSQTGGDTDDTNSESESSDSESESAESGDESDSDESDAADNEGGNSRARPPNPPDNDPDSSDSGSDNSNENSDSSDDDSDSDVEEAASILGFLKEKPTEFKTKRAKRKWKKKFQKLEKLIKALLGSKKSKKKNQKKSDQDFESKFTKELRLKALLDAVPEVEPDEVCSWLAEFKLWTAKMRELKCPEEALSSKLKTVVQRNSSAKDCLKGRSFDDPVETLLDLIEEKYAESLEDYREELKEKIYNTCRQKWRTVTDYLQDRRNEMDKLRAVGGKSDGRYLVRRLIENSGMGAIGFAIVREKYNSNSEMTVMEAHRTIRNADGSHSGPFVERKINQTQKMKQPHQPKDNDDDEKNKDWPGTSKDRKEKEEKERRRWKKRVLKMQKRKSQCPNGGATCEKFVNRLLTKEGDRCELHNGYDAAQVYTKIEECEKQGIKDVKKIAEFTLPDDHKFWKFENPK